MGNHPVGAETLPTPLSHCVTENAFPEREPTARLAAIIKNDVEGAGTQFVLDGVAAPDRDLKAPPSPF